MQTFGKLSIMKRRESLKVLGSIPFLAFGGINSVGAKQIEKSRLTFAASPKNIILVLADGMGVAQWQAGAIGNGGSLNVGRMTHTGLLTTNPLDNFCGDAPSHCTALACGVNSHKGAVGVDKDDKPLPNIRTEKERIKVKTIVKEVVEALAAYL